MVEDRKAKLSSFLQYCLSSDAIRLEKNLYIWKFLAFENAGLSITRFVLGPDFVRDNLFRTLPKLTQPGPEAEKYKNDLFRLAHPDFLSVCIQVVMVSTRKP